MLRPHLDRLARWWEDLVFDYDDFLKEHIVKGEWRFERTYGRLEKQMIIRFIRYLCVLFFSMVWETCVPISFFWAVALPAYINWIAYSGWDFLKPWKSPILLSMLVVLPFKFVPWDMANWSWF